MNVLLNATVTVYCVPLVLFLLAGFGMFVCILKSTKNSKIFPLFSQCTHRVKPQQMTIHIIAHHRKTTTHLSTNISKTG